MKMLKRILPNRGGRSLKLIKIPTTQLSKPEQDMEYDFDCTSEGVQKREKIKEQYYEKMESGSEVDKKQNRAKKGIRHEEVYRLQDQINERSLKQSVDAGQSEENNVSTQQYIVFPLWSSISSSYKSSDENDTTNDSAGEPLCNRELFQGKATKANSTNSFNNVSTPVNAASASRTSNDAGSSSIPLVLEADFNNMEPSTIVSPIPTTRVRSDTICGFSKKRSREDSNEDNAKKQKLENNAEKKDLRDSMDVVPRDDIAIDIESLATKYPIVDWKIHVLTENMMYYQIIRADGSSKNYKIFSEMLDDFDRQDVLDLHILVQERYDTTSPEGYDLLLWEDMKILFEPNKEDEIWKNQQDYNLISWRLSDSCGIHMLLMHT
ncbi:hypothetical protein Tco_0066320 [Tanacetum coccineum]